MKGMKKSRFEGGDIAPVIDWVRPDPRNFPDIDLSVCDNIRPSRGQMPVHTCPNSVGRLPDINRDLIQVAQHVAANLVGQCAHGSAPKSKIDSHGLFGSDHGWPQCALADQIL